MDVSSLANTASSAAALGGLILVTPQKTVGYQPQNFPSYVKDTLAQSPALLFHYEGENSVDLVSDITDHYIENNTAINDQISLKPETITTQGFIGELNNVAPIGLQTLKTVANKLVAVGPFAPSLSISAIVAYNQAAQAYAAAVNVANAAVGAWASVSGGATQTVIGGDGVAVKGVAQTKQQIAFQQFYGYWKSRTLFTIQTPWAVFQDVAIMRLRAVQSSETELITDFEVTFKLLRFASTSEIAGTRFQSDNSQGRASSQGADVVDLGSSTLQASPVSFLSTVA